MGNAPRRAERLKRETIGGEQFVTETEEDALERKAITEGKPVRPKSIGEMPQQERMPILKALAKAEGEALQMLRDLDPENRSRHIALARQCMENAFMWAQRHVIKAQPKQQR